jgi:hypothetical protein
MVARQKLSGAGPMPGVGPELMRSASCSTWQVGTGKISS